MMRHQDFRRTSQDKDNRGQALRTGSFGTRQAAPVARAVGGDSRDGTGCAGPR